MIPVENIIGKKLNAFFLMKDLQEALENGAYDNIFPPSKVNAELRLNNHKESLGISNEESLKDAKKLLLDDFQKYLMYQKGQELGMNYKSDHLTFEYESYTAKHTYVVTYEMDDVLRPRIVLHSGYWESKVDHHNGTIVPNTIE